MMPTITPYNHTRMRTATGGGVDIANLKVMLLSGHTFDPTHTNISSIEGDEVHGNGWAEGGEPLANATITVTSTNEATLDADDILETADGGPIGPADGAVIYHDDTGAEYPLWFVDPDGAQEAADGTDFQVNLDEDGLHVWAEPAA
jgi:hypothetical protein